MASLRIFVVILYFIIFVTLSTKWDEDVLDEGIYTWSDNEAMCVRLSTINNRTGCASYTNGNEGQLRYANNITQILNLIHSDIKYPIALVLPLTMISKIVLDTVQNGFNDNDLAGIIFVQENDNLVPPINKDGFSVDQKSPMYYLRPNTQMNNNIYEWNKQGTSIMFNEYEFSIIALNAAESSNITDMARDNENSILNNNFGVYFAEFNYPMIASNDSITCLNNDNCLPLGGYSVWTTFQNMSIDNYNYSALDRKLILAITSIDTTALFHNSITRGGNANQAGLVAFLGAINALSNIKDIMSSLEKQIIFAAFEGETYDLVGSRKFIYDITMNESCNEYMQSDYGFGCWEPYSSTLEYKKLNLSLIDFIIELNQIGISNENNDRIIYTHYETKNSYIDSVINDLKNISQIISEQKKIGYSIQEPITSINGTGTPPSSFWSFLDYNISIPGIVLSDFETEYKNKWFHSVYDSFYNSLNMEQICMTSTLYARMLYKMAANDEQYNDTIMNEYINADCVLIEQLLECFLINLDCDIIKSFNKQESIVDNPKYPSHYTSVYKITEDQFIDGFNTFLFRYMSNLTKTLNGPINDECEANKDCWSKYDSSYLCSSLGNNKLNCIQSNTYYHAAVDTNLIFNYNTYLWEFNQSVLTSNTSRQTLLTTESMWVDNLGTRWYRKESPKSQLIILIIGSSNFVFSFFVIWYLKSYCNSKFISLSR